MQNNTAQEGGAIDGDTTNINSNGSLSFVENTATVGSGGALAGIDIQCSANNNISFSGNYSGMSGGAIIGSASIDISNNATVNFYDNFAEQQGGAIWTTPYAYIGEGLTLHNNGSIYFKANKSGAGGGAIYGTVEFLHNKDVYFHENETGTNGGGILLGDKYGNNGKLLMEENETIEFNNNKAINSGGAIYGRNFITLSGNGRITFSGNQATSAGGAIHAEVLSITGNDEVNFVGNTLHSPDGSAYGGAIYSSSVMLHDNGTIVFSQNGAFSAAETEGGAICTGLVSIRNNEAVLFEKNVEKSQLGYRMRSIYANSNTINLSAAADKSIEFRDSVYFRGGSNGYVHLNEDYLGEDGVTYKQEGDIIFTGAYIKENLKAALAADGLTRSVKANEMLRSRTSIVYSMTNLYGGRLRVEDGAAYEGWGITVMADSGAALCLNNGSLNHYNNRKITFERGSTLELQNNNSIVGDTIMEAGSAITFHLGSSNLGSSLLSYSGTLTFEGALDIHFDTDESQLWKGQYQLITVSGKIKGWDAQNITVNGGEIGAGALVWIGKTLYFNMENSHLTSIPNNSDGDITVDTRPSLLWQGGEKGVWKTGGNGWSNMAGDGVIYSNDYKVTIEDGKVVITGDVSPEDILLTPSKKLTFSTQKGTIGRITGETSLTVVGNPKSTIILNDGNTYSGGTTIYCGTVKAGGAESFGVGNIYAKGGVLNLASKAVANNIIQEGNALIKSGKNFRGNYTLLSGTLMKGSLLKVEGTATLSGGSIDGTINGNAAEIIGDVSLKNNGKLQLINLTINSDGLLTAEKNGLSMTGKTSQLNVYGSIVSEGKLNLNSLMLQGGYIDLYRETSNEKIVSLPLTVTNAIEASSGSTIYTTGNLKAKSLTLTGNSKVDSSGNITLTDKLALNTVIDSTLSSWGSINISGSLLSINSILDASDGESNKTCSITVKGDLIIDGTGKDTPYALWINGKLSSNSLTATNANLVQANYKTPQSIAIKGKNVANVFTNSSLIATGSMTVAGSLMLNDSSIILEDESDKPKPMSMTVKGKLEVIDSAENSDADAEISLSGNLVTGCLEMMNADLKLSNGNSSRLQSISLTQSALSKTELVTNKLTHSDIYVQGGMKIAGNLELYSSTIHLNDDLELSRCNLSVNGDLLLDRATPTADYSELSINGRLSTGNLTIAEGSRICLTGTKFIPLTVNGTLTLNGAHALQWQKGLQIKQNQTYNLITFRSTNLTSGDNLYEYLTLNPAYCTLSLTDKAITLLVTPTQWEKWKEDHSGASVQATAVAAAYTPESESESDAETPVEESDIEAATPTTVLTLSRPELPDYSGEANALVQANWGLFETSHAFVNTIANRSKAILPDSREQAVWVGAIAGSGRISGTGERSGSDTNIMGGAIGIESLLGQNSLLGIAMGNSRTRVSTHNFGTIKQDTTHLGVYGQTKWTQLQADWSVAGGHTESEYQGRDWSQKAVQIDGHLSYNHALSDTVQVRGFGGLQYFAGNSARFAGINTGKVQNLRGEIGVGIVHSTQKSTFYTELALRRDLVRDNPEVTTPFGQRYYGTNPERTSLNISVGGSYALSEEWSLNASYSAEIIENANAHHVNVGATYKF